VAEATAESIRQVTTAIREGGESYLRYRQVEMLPDIAPVLADALAKAKMVTIAGGGGAAASVMSNITAVIQTVLAAQLVTKRGCSAGLRTGNHRNRLSLSRLNHRLPGCEAYPEVVQGTTDVHHCPVQPPALGATERSDQLWRHFTDEHLTGRVHIPGR